MINYEDENGDMYSRPYHSFFSQELMTDGIMHPKFEDVSMFHYGKTNPFVDRWTQEILSMYNLNFVKAQK